ncbi:unnamed protein product [Rotaria magnacalcarata]|uniref:Tetratricopeptide repeat protein n=1 Tax=Rotaria magnacalcarata TaxID=392030 RepID=A0A815CW09_9BILA|nr:unnamed protein product [Rotaria magnacalcarata]CAF3932971.1 unnamed protein product [Rotaria magnacalcarata]
MANSTKNTTKQHPVSDMFAESVVEKTLLVWVNSTVEEHEGDFRHTFEQLHKLIRHVSVFAQIDHCVRFLAGVPNEKAIVVVSSTFGQDMIPQIHSMTQVDTIYLLGDVQAPSEQWTKEWPKIKGQYSSVTSVFEAIRRVNKQYNEDSIPISFMPIMRSGSTHNIDQLDPSFMYTQLFKNTVVQMEHSRQSVDDFVAFCRDKFRHNASVLCHIDEFERGYRSDQALYWYTRFDFIYGPLNRCLRLLEADVLMNMGFFIQDLHRQIERFYQEHIGQFHGKSFLLYRGQGLSYGDFEKLKKAEGGLLSFNCFLSTSKEREVSFLFAESTIQSDEKIGILFVMTIDPSVTSTPFADISNESYFELEAEILFSMHTVFRIEDIKKLDNNERLFEVCLKLTSDDDKELKVITDLFEEDLKGGTGWARLGNLLCKVGQFDKAEELYHALVQQATTQNDTAFYYDHLGVTQTYKNNYLEAIKNFEKSLSIREIILTENDPDLAATYNNMGLAYEKMKDYSNALLFHQKALSIWEKLLPEHSIDLTASYNNIGSVYDGMKEYPKALQFYEKTLSIAEKNLPGNHPDLAVTYNNIGHALDKMRDYSKAQYFYEKALVIWEKTLPRNHPDLATLRTNLVSLHAALGNHSEALGFAINVISTEENNLPRNLPDYSITYNHTGEYSQALSSMRALLEVQQHSLSSNHPDQEHIRECIEFMKLLESD